VLQSLFYPNVVKLAVELTRLREFVQESLECSNIYIAGLHRYIKFYQTIPKSRKVGYAGYWIPAAIPLRLQ